MSAMNRPTRVVLIAGGVAAVAAVLNRVGLSRVTSKYAGETEKSLDGTLAEAEAHDDVLLVDDPDALFDTDAETDYADPD